MSFLRCTPSVFVIGREYEILVSLTRVEPNKVLRAKKCLYFVNLAYDTASIASFGFLVYSTFLPLKTALHHKRVFFSGFLA